MRAATGLSAALILVGCMSSGDKGTSNDPPANPSIPQVQGAQFQYDSSRGILRLSWKKPSFAKVAEFFIYRTAPGGTPSKFEPTAKVKDTVLIDTLYRTLKVDGKEVWSDTQPAEYEYSVRIRSTEDELGPASAITPVKVPAPAPIPNPEDPKGIPVVVNLSQRYDTTLGIAHITWRPVRYGNFAEYLVYRGFPGILPSVFSPANRQADTAFADTLFRRTTIDGKKVWLDTQTTVYEYTVRVRNVDDEIGGPSAGIGVKAVSPAYFDLLNRQKIPVVEGLAATYDTANGTLVLSWRPPAYPELKEYLIYRSPEGAAAPKAPYEIRQDSVLNDWVFPSEIKNGRRVYPDTLAKTWVYSVAVRNLDGEIGARSPEIKARCVSPLTVQTSIAITVSGYLRGPGLAPVITPYDTVRLVVKFKNEGRANERAVWTIRWLEWSGHYSEDTLAVDTVSGKEGADSLVMIWKFPFPFGLANFYVSMTDEAGMTWKDSTAARFIEGRPILSAMATPSLGLMDPIRLYATGRVREEFGRIVKYEWDIGNKGNFVTVTNGDTVVPAPKLPGDFNCVLKVTDDDGLEATWGSIFPIINWKFREAVQGQLATNTVMARKLYYQALSSVGGPEVIEFDVESGIQTRYPVKGSGRLRASASKIYFVQASSAVFEFNPSIGEWASRGNLSGWIDSANGFQAFLVAALGRINGDLYMLIERELEPSTNPKMSNWLMKYNPLSGKWEKKATFPTSIAVSADNVMFINGEIFAIQGSIYAYNPMTDSWSLRVDLPSFMSDFGVASLTEHDGHLTFGAGFKGGFPNSFVQYIVDFNPASNQVNVIAAPPGNLNSFTWVGDRLFGSTLSTPQFQVGGKYPTTIQILEYDGTPGWAIKSPIKLPDYDRGALTPFAHWNGSLYVNIKSDITVNFMGEIKQVSGNSVIEYILYD